MVILDFSFPSCQNLWPTVGFGRSRKLKRTEQLKNKRARAFRIAQSGVCYSCCLLLLLLLYNQKHRLGDVYWTNEWMNVFVNTWPAKSEVNNNHDLWTNDKQRWLNCLVRKSVSAHFFRFSTVRLMKNATKKKETSDSSDYFKLQTHYLQFGLIMNIM